MDVQLVPSTGACSCEIYTRAGCNARRAPGLAGARRTSSAVYPREAGQQRASRAAPHQTLAFRAATGKAFTIFLAGLAFTMTTFPKTSLLPALVAGFIRVLILHKPGSVKMPLLTTSFVAMSARLPMSFAQTPFLSSHSVARASARAPLVMALAVAFMGAILCTGEGAGQRRANGLVLLS